MDGGSSDDGGNRGEPVDAAAATSVNAETAKALETVQKRWRVLERLARGPATKPEVVASLDVSRSTVDRAVRDLQDLSLVERRDGTFATTLAGRLALESFRRFRSRVSAVADARDLLSYLDPDCGLSAAALVGAEVHVSERPATYRPGEELSDLIRAAERVRALSTAVSHPSSTDLVHGAVVGGTEYVGVFTAEVARFLREEHGERFREMAETGRFDVRVADSLPFGLFLLTVDDGGVPDRAGGEREGATREVVAVVVYDDESNLQGVLVNDTGAAVQWAEEYFRAAREAAEPLTESFL